MDCETVLTTYLNSYSASRSERKTNRKTISAHFVESSVAKERSVCASMYNVYVRTCLHVSSENNTLRY